MKVFKIILVIVLVIIALVIITPLAFQGKIRNLVLKEANKSLTAKLDVGKVKISLIRNFPSASVRLQQILITGQGAFDQDTLVNIESIAIRLNIMDLIGGSPYEIKGIDINQADVRLKILADGMANWDIVKSSGDEVSEKQTSAGQDNFRLKLKSLLISDSRLVYDDMPGSTYVVLEGLNHTLSGDLGEDVTILETFTDIRKSLLVYDGINYLNEAVIKWKADIDANLKENLYTFKDNKLTINDFPLVFDGSVGLPVEGYDLKINFSTPETSFKSLLSLIPAVYSRDFASVKTDGRISFWGNVTGLYTEEMYPGFLLKLNVADAWFQYPDLPAPVNAINIDAKIENPGGDLDNTIIDIKNLDMNLAGNPVSASLYLKNPMTDPYIDTRIEAKVNLAEVKNFYPPGPGEELNGSLMADITLKGILSDIEKGNYKDFDARGNFSTSGIDYSTPYLAPSLKIEKAIVTITPARLDIPELRLKAGNSDFSLNGNLGNYLGYFLKDETLAGDFDLRSSRIDVNELLAFPENGEETVAEDTAALSAFIVPENMDISIKISAGTVEYEDYLLSSLTGRIRIRDEKLFLEELSMNGLGGRLQMTGSYNSADPENPVVDFNLGMKEISIGETFKQVPLVEKFAPIAEKILGDFSGNIRLSGFLDGQMMPRLESLKGAGDLITSAIRVSNVNTLNQLSTSLKMDQLKDLQVAGAKIIVEFMEGMMEVKPFDFKALGIDMNLSGQTSLDQKIGYVLKMKVPRSMMGGAANNALDELVARVGQTGAKFEVGDYVNLDALIRGTITDPKVSIDLTGTGKGIIESVKDQVQQQVEQKVDDLKKDAKAEADKILQEADRQAQSILDLAKKQSEEVLNSAAKLADEAKKQASAGADKVVQEAKGKGYVAELAAKKSADEVRKQGDKQAQNILDEANKKSASILEKARQEADKVKAEARKKAGL